MTLMVTVDLKDILKLIFRISITIIMIGLVIWGVYWFNHGGQAQMTQWLNDGTKWILRKIVEHKVLLGSIVGTFGLIGIVILIILDD